MKKCFTYQEVKWLQGVVSLSVIYLLIEKKYIKVQYNFTDTVDQASNVNPNRQYSRSSPQLTNRLGRARKMAVPSPIGDVKIVSQNSTFVLNTLTLK